MMTGSAKWRFYFDDREVAAACLAKAATISQSSSNGVCDIGYKPGIYDTEIQNKQAEPKSYQVLEKTFLVDEQEIVCPAYQIFNEEYEFGIWIDFESHPPIHDHWNGQRGDQSCWLLGIEAYTVTDENSCMLFMDIGLLDFGISIEASEDKHLSQLYEVLTTGSKFVVKSAECIGDLLLVKHKNFAPSKPIGLVDLPGYDRNDDDLIDIIDDINLVSDPIFEWLSQQQIGE